MLRISVMLRIYNGDAVFDWDESNLRKIRAHRIILPGAFEGSKR